MTWSTPLLAAEVIRTRFEWGRIQSNSDWILPVAVCLAILLFVRYLYRRDAVELRPVWGWLLTGLRTLTILALLVFYLQPHWRSEREEVRNSRAVLLVDTSLSMNLADEPGSDPGSRQSSRDQQIAAALRESDFVGKLRKTHDVSVYTFGEELKREHVVTLPKESPQQDGPAQGSAVAASPGEPQKKDVAHDWAKLLTPAGAETRLGQALRQLVQEERGTPVSGVIVFSDGGQNAGISADSAVELAQEAKIPIFTVGVGSDRLPVNVVVSDFVAPVRAYPGDRYAATGYLQAQGFAGKTVTVEVLSRAASNGAEKAGQAGGAVVASRQVTLGGDGEVLPVKFDLVPDSVGRKTLTFRVQSPQGDRNPSDNAREADIEIVERKNHVLLIADGPMRDYQFLRNLLYRDRYTTVDVLLQSGKPGMSQESKKLLSNFPTTREEMYDYDCVVAFDPNWQNLTASQVELLEKWVSEQGGGLIVVAGPVNASRGTGGWVQNRSMAAIRNLYPVEFPSRLAALDNSMYGGREPASLNFTREGLDADFLWLADTATASQAAWASFPGVYSYCPVRGAKPGATVYARFADPQASLPSEQPPYLVGQFYGAGSVFYLGSGELWRLRAINEGYFEQLYTKLIRHVSQGRLLRGSNRGVLLVGQDRYLLGNTVEVRAQLTNLRLEPLLLPSVNLQVTSPEGASQTVALKPDPSRAGAYLGQFPALQEGTYRLDLAVPESQNERLSRRIQVKAPDLERENPRRNDALLSTIAKQTGGKYYVGVQAATATTGPNSLVDQLMDRTSVVIQPVAPNPQREELWLKVLMVVLCGLLCLEWLIRRLMKLA